MSPSLDTIQSFYFLPLTAIFRKTYILLLFYYIFLLDFSLRQSPLFTPLICPFVLKGPRFYTEQRRFKVLIETNIFTF